MGEYIDGDCDIDDICMDYDIEKEDIDDIEIKYVSIDPNSLRKFQEENR
jgi:hypothetical protein